MAVTDCRHFNGYKPCGKSTDCSIQCLHIDRPRVRILIIHLGAMGAVVRSTAMLAAIKRKYPSSQITWVTQSPLQELLALDPRLDRVLTTSLEDQLVLRALEFDVAFIIDKSLVAAGILQLTKADLVYGFRVDPQTGAVLPATSAAKELWELGLDDHRKFFVNKKTESQLQVEALELGIFRRDEYALFVTDHEDAKIKTLQSLWRLQKDQPIIGFNTGCGPLMPAKKWTVEFHRRVIQRFIDQGYKNIVLLGGSNDSDRNKKIGENFPVIQSSTNLGMREGLANIAACDVVLTGDSLGMHLAIAMKKFVVAWFGPSCSQEIDLFDRGVKLETQLSCHPCWKRHCAKTEMCYDHVSLQEIECALAKGIAWWSEQRQLQSPQTEINPS